MGRRLRTTPPTIPSKLIPQWPELAKFCETEEKIKSKQVVQYNQRHAAKELSNLLPGDRVYVPDRRENAVVVGKTPEPRSYLIETDSNAAIRRNRRQLTPNSKDTAVPPGDVPQIPAMNPPGQTQGKAEKAREPAQKPNSEIPVPSTRSGRRVVPPKRLASIFISSQVKQEDTDWRIRKEKAIASRSALHKASVNGQFEEVQKYLSSGCAVDVKDQFSLTPLHLACWYGQESIVKLLLQHGADVNATDRFQFTPLHKAERRNHESIVKLLLDNKAIPTLQQPPSLRTLGRRAFTRIDEHSGFNLLQSAVLKGDYDTFEKASVHLENFVEEMKCQRTGEKASIFPGQSAADILSVRKKRNFWRTVGKSVVVKKTLKGSRKSSDTKKTFEMYTEFVGTEKTLTKLHSCAKGNDVEMAIELVLNDSIDVNVATTRNITPLLWASTAASSLSIKTLIDLGADVNARTFQESTFGFSSDTALRSAIHGNNANVVKVLLTNKADANIADLQGNTLLHSSTSKGFFSISQLLIDSGCRMNVRNRVGETPVHSTVRGKNVAYVKRLLSNNADANIQDSYGNTPLHISTREGLCDISQLLVDSGSKINVRNNDGETLLHSSVRGKSVADVKLLLGNIADANIQDNQGNTPLHISTREGLCHISQLLVDSGCKINVRNYNRETPLHFTVRGRNVVDVKLLLSNNADANIQDNRGSTPLHISTREGLCDISQLLVDSGCKINVRNNDGETPLHSTLRGKNVAYVKLLLRNNADANIQDDWGSTPLHISTREGLCGISQLLSTREGLCDISQLLVDSGSKINVRNNGGETPLNSTVRGKNVGDVKLLLSNNADANIEDYQGNSPLHISTRKALCDISQLLVDSGCKINVRNNDGETPLHSSVRGKNKLPVVKLLLKNNADSNVQDNQGNTPLHISTPEGLSDISQLLIDSGSNKNLTNREGKTPLDLKPFFRYAPYAGDSEEAKGNEGHAYAPQKGFRNRSFFGSEPKGDPWMNQPTQSNLPSPLLGKVRSGSPLKNQPELSSALSKRRMGYVSPPTLYGDLEDDQRNTGYASQKSFRHKTVAESEHEDDALINPETVSSPIVGKGKEQSST
ncbi:PREDICTED: ankyrin-1-like [Acropora digitifera]|uniref:ankyrin-1-like n=1 Tax=Acropora digitifera TaxID=70779 RepID=UPI00077ACA73|nr:PREDICTED: ankyrin-1-like [Acropora digitifera]